MILYSSKNAFIEYIDNGKIVLKRFSNQCVGIELRDAFQAGLDGIKSNNGCKWLSDDRSFQVPYPKEDAEWINTIWIPQMLNAGWKYWAIIEPENLPMKNFLSNYQRMGIILQTYRNIEDALLWLRSV